MFISDVHIHSVFEWCVTCRLSSLDEELLLLCDREVIFCDMAELRSSEPIALQNARPEQATDGEPGSFLF